MSDNLDDLRRLVADLSTAPERARGEIQQVVSKGALNIKGDWRDRVSGLHRLKHLRYAVDYDLLHDVDSIGADIGYNRARVQAPLGNIEEFGTANTPGHLDGQHALDTEEPKFIAALEDVAEGAVLS